MTNTNKARITRKAEGQPITFHGFDGQDYSGNIVRVFRRGVQIEYAVPVDGMLRNCTAHVLNADRDRIETVAEMTPATAKAATRAHYEREAARVTDSRDYEDCHSDADPGL